MTTIGRGIGGSSSDKHQVYFLNILEKNWQKDNEKNVYRQQIIDIPITNSTKVDLDIDATTAKLLPSSIRATNYDGNLYLETKRPPDIDLTIQFTAYEVKVVNNI